jgi:hypothetical protein
MRRPPRLIRKTLPLWQAPHTRLRVVIVIQFDFRCLVSELQIIAAPGGVAFNVFGRMRLGRQSERFPRILQIMLGFAHWVTPLSNQFLKWMETLGQRGGATKGCQAPLGRRFRASRFY